jgi:hypothetical protein
LWWSYYFFHFEVVGLAGAIGEVWPCAYPDLVLAPPLDVVS